MRWSCRDWAALFDSHDSYIGFDTGAERDAVDRGILVRGNPRGRSHINRIDLHRWNFPARRSLASLHGRTQDWPFAQQHAAIDSSVGKREDRHRRS